MNTGIWIIGVILVLILAGIWWYTTTIPAQAPESLPEEQTTSPTATDIPTSPLALPTETTVLSAVAPYTGSGTATRTWDGTTFSHTTSANIPDPPTGKFYEGWLVNLSGPTFFSTGKLTKKDGAYVLTYMADQDYPDHDQVVITLETESLGLDGKPEVHVLEGIFEGAVD